MKHDTGKERNLDLLETLTLEFKGAYTAGDGS
jgi:hypothetical protein